MKKIGIVGGIGWPSTIEYYRLICEASQQYHNDIEFSGPVPMPEISIESLNMNFTVNNRGSSESGSWDKWDACFKTAISHLEDSGAELIVLASVTPHGRLVEISEGVRAPIISVYDSIGRHCNLCGIEKLLIFGTMPTMTSPAFKDGMEKFGIKVIYPPTDELKANVLKVIEELYQNKTDGTSSVIDEIVRSCLSENQLNSTAVCLGCTELPLAFDTCTGKPDFEHGGVRYLNSTVVHALSAFEACVN
jgi:aspartate racemase